MKNLIYKEFKLCMQPLVWIFFAFVLMLLIPNYIYLVPCFFVGNAIFQTMQVGAVNNDVLFSNLLPVSKRDTVKAKYLFVICVELIMTALYVGMIFVNHKLIGSPNMAGIDACPALIGGCFLIHAVFNAIFLPVFYKSGFKAGRAFVFSAIAVFAVMFVFEGIFIAAGAAADKSALFAAIESTIDCWPETGRALSAQLIFTGAFAVLYAVVTWLSYLHSASIFEKSDI